MHGVHAAIVTHFDERLEIDDDATAAEVERLIGGGIHGIVACGTMGESGSLTPDERASVLRTAVSAAAGRVPVCAGVSAASAAQAIAYARDAAAGGADSLMLLPPLLYRADRRELLEFFGAVGAATELPLMIYNNPEAAGVDLAPALLAEIVAAIPSVTAIKECSGDARRLAQLIDLCPGTDVLVGGDDWVLEGCAAGAAGWISGIAVVLPRQCVELWELGTAARLAEARALYQQLLPLARFDMTSKLVQYFKAALDAIGVPAGPCRPPRLPLGELELGELRAAVERATAQAAGAVGV